STERRTREMTEANQVPQKVGVLGGGRMGAGIAHSFLAAGAEVTVVDINDEAVAAAAERISNDVDGSLRRGAEGTREEWLSRLTVTTDTGAFAGLPLVVEAVPESMDLKISSFRKIAEASPEAVIATNTS